MNKNNVGLTGIFFFFRGSPFIMAYFMVAICLIVDFS